MGCLLGVAGLAMIAAPSASAEVVSFAAESDCSYSERRHEKDCTAETLTVGLEGTDAVWRTTSTLEFDPAAGLPSGAQIVSATLHAYGSFTQSGFVDAASVAANIALPSDYEDAVEFQDGAPAVWAEWDVTQSTRDAVAYSSEAVIELAPAPDTYLIPMEWSFVSSESTDTTHRPYLEVEYFVPCPSDPYAAAQSSAPGTVYDVNEMVLNVFRVGGAPGPLSRAGAMVFTGVYDVFNSVFFAKLEQLSTGTPTSSQVCGWEPFTVLADADPSTNTRLAAGIAARDILLDALPARATTINDEYDRLFGSETSQAAAEELGAFVADEVMAARAGDGSGASSYTSASTTAGAWRPTPTASTEVTCNTDADAVTPGWGNVTPFALTSGTQFRQTLPGGYSSYTALLASSLYADQVNEVKQYGGATSTARTLPQTKLAWFWANDLDRTYKPPGQLLEHTRIVAQTQPAAHTSGAPGEFYRRWSRQGIRVARLFAEVSVALADAAIAAWDQKYRTTIDLWRPETAIHEPQSDGNLATTPDTGWKPLSADRDDVSFSPCFPAWVSGHATFGGAWGETMDNEFADADFTHPFPLTLTSEDPHAVRLGATSRQFYSFQQAADENALSRIYLGVHYRFDAEDGLATGRAVADQVTSTKLRWQQTCPSWDCGEEID